MMIDEKTKIILTDKFRNLKRNVDIKVFTRSIIVGGENLIAAERTKNFIKEISQITDKINVEFLNLHDSLAKELNLEMSPTVVIGKNLGYSIEYWGSFLGYEISSFIETIICVSNGESYLTDSSKEKLKYIDKDVLIEVFVTPNCPYCPQAVLLANKISVQIPGKVKSRCINAEEAREKALEFKITSVPTIIINGDYENQIIGLKSEEEIVNKVLLIGATKGKEVLMEEERKEMEKRKLLDEPDYPVYLDENNFEEALKKYKILIVDFWAEWCMPCRIIAPIIEKLAKKYKGKVVFGKVNVDRAPSLADRFGIMSIPTLIYFKNGEKVDETVGVIPETAIEEKIRNLE